jgi:DNA-directed RNA polymerase subunit RPC12/RpoP
MIIACTHCSSAIRVQAEEHSAKLLVGDKSDFWPDKYPCYHCGQKVRAFLDPEIAAEALAALDVVDLTAEETFAAIMGLGVPDEQTCCEEVVVPLFEKYGLGVKGRQIRNSLRYCLEYIEFPDGTRLHLAASPQGATAYRIAKRHSYVKEALDED